MRSSAPGAMPPSGPIAVAVRLRWPMAAIIKQVSAGVAEPVDATDLGHALSAPAETRDVELPKLGEPCEMAIPSQARNRQAPDGKV
jgi:hypothetical protein